MSIFGNLDGTFRNRFSLGKPKGDVYLERSGSNLQLRDLVVTTAQNLVDLISRARTSQLAGLTEATSAGLTDLLLLELASGGALRKITKENLDPFGRHYQMQESTAESSTTSTSFQTKVSLTSPAATGTFRIGWVAMVNDNDKVGEIQVYNVTDAAVVGIAHPHKLKDNYWTLGFVEYVALTGTAKVFALQYRSTDGGVQYIKEARMEFWRVS